MPVSKQRKSHKKYANQFKKQIKQKMTNQQNAQQYPPVRSIPVWKNDAVITLSGLEWEAIQNSLTQIQLGQQAAQAVMSRNIINGVIGMEFEKLNPETLEYGSMTTEEKAPYIADLQKAIEAIKNPPKPAEQAVSQIVDAQGENIAKQEAPVVNMTESPDLALA